MWGLVEVELGLRVEITVGGDGKLVGFCLNSERYRSLSINFVKVDLKK